MLLSLLSGATNSSGGYVFLGFFIILIILSIMWWIQRNERKRIVELNERVTMLTKIVQDTAQNINNLTQSQNQYMDNQNSGMVQVENHSGNDIANEQQDNGGVDVDMTMDVIQEVDISQETEREEREERELELEGEETDDEDEDEDDEHSELDSLTDEELVADVKNYNEESERIEVSDIEETDISTPVQHSFSPLNDTTVVKNIRLSENGTFDVVENSQTMDMSSIVVDKQTKVIEDTTQPDFMIDEEMQRKYSKMTVKELRKIGEENGFTNMDKTKKQTIVNMLSRVPIQSGNSVDE